MLEEDPCQSPGNAFQYSGESNQSHEEAFIRIHHHGSGGQRGDTGGLDENGFGPAWLHSPLAECHAERHEIILPFSHFICDCFDSRLGMLVASPGFRSMGIHLPEEAGLPRFERRLVLPDV
jgi:hypothetical protein